RTKTDEAPKPSSGKRVKATAKVAKSGNKKQPAHGSETLSEIALTEGVTLGVLDVPEYGSDDEKLSWKSSDEEDDDEENVGKNKDDDEENVSEHEDDDDDERTEFDNDGDDFVHPKFSTHDDEAMQDEEVNEEDSFDTRVQTPSHVESTNDKDNDEEVQGVNIKGEEMDEEANNEEDEGMNYTRI
ncbi:hypothetical protein Tco_1136723, partial [Tanacetum coccineum]